MTTRQKFKDFTEKTAAYLKGSPNILFKENPHIIKNIVSENWDSNVENILSRLDKALKAIKNHETLEGIQIGSFCFQWNDFDHNSFDILLSSSNVYEPWMDSDLENFAQIDMEPILAGIFSGIEDRTEELHDDLDTVNELMAALMETAILEAAELGTFHTCPCLDPFLITLRMWHDVEISLVYHSRGDLKDELYLTIDNPPDIFDTESGAVNQSTGDSDGMIQIGRDNFRHDEKWVRCYDTGISKIPTAIGRLVKAKELNLSRNNIKSVPVEMWKMTGLKDINLSGNKINELPEGIGALKKLEKADFSQNKLKSLPSDITELSALEHLDLRHNNLEGIPADMEKLEKLTMINLSENRLMELPSMPESLEWLQLVGNRLCILPESIAALKNLKHLMIQYNEFTEVPDVIFQLTSLESLGLGNNPIEKIPEELFSLPKLVRIDFRPNLFSVEERERLRDEYGEKIFLGYDSDEGSFMKI
ncbi:MAG TPA: leucine-rich repeat domain-containing protein [Spirochaetota bacterium]|mgnify:CR=1 FL=1|nr:leucine-rich repeat domain-containing protein [Spirochaetota bacterium]HPJ35706.1 leucine-rich repeat domain-containing protein [Spirochaetota bacterium]